MKEYNEILDTMNEKYNELAGFIPDEASDIGIRMRVLAGELCNLSSAVEAVKNRSFIETAEGDYLTSLGKERGLERHEAVKAQGTLTFSRAQALNYSLPIPKGTVCYIGGSSLRYLTTESAELPALETAVAVSAEAEEGGSSYNCAEGAINTMVSPPAGIEAVTSSAFSGGMEEENDSSYRHRLQVRCSALPSGANRSFFEAIAEAVDGIYSAQAVSGTDAGTVTVYACEKGGALSDEVKALTEAALEESRPLGISVTVTAPTQKKIRVIVNVEVAPGLVFSDIQAELENICREHIEKHLIGESFYSSQLISDLMDSGLISRCTLSSFTKDTAVGTGEVAAVNSISVSEL